MCTKKVREWLVLLTMEKYVRCFTEHGYISIAQCQQILTSDLIMLGIDNPTHRQLLLTGVQLLINSPNLFVCPEPCELHVSCADQDLAEDFLDTCKIDLQAIDSSFNTPQHGHSKNKFGFLARTKRERKSKSKKSKETLCSVNIKANFTCVACPHLQFGQLYELDEHIAALKESKDSSASQHKYGDLITNVQEATPIILIE
ncbi:uncharacterized protein [Drosophila virilis]|uniref:SAM domain-containing protein n=1 Tax=Drosophila virilis TaxID=7244 RepID=B4M643_DROVI|nr:uncharacterized protein LOC6632384 [Drosophila virilis]EDW59119.1 uncharacterized protein Dvir_GJ10459 [Drosophila virilis]